MCRKGRDVVWRQQRLFVVPHVVRCAEYLQKLETAKEKATRRGGHGRDQEVELMVSMASLGETVTVVDHGGRKKDSVEVRERKKR
ncbi:hypothetical protein D5086_011134 [Populus alba]|uniref:Uncharacterized protein n=1 Tax=Populus alba TaxID=43335 RepID=A0ACC4CCZ0_POPAL